MIPYPLYNTWSPSPLKENRVSGRVKIAREFVIKWREIHRICPIPCLIIFKTWCPLKENCLRNRVEMAREFVIKWPEICLNLSDSLPDNSWNMIPLKENWACIREKIARKSAFLRMILQPEIVRDFVKMLSSVISILCSVCERIGRYLFPKIIQQFTSFLSKLFLNLLLFLYCVKTKIVSIRETFGSSCEWWHRRACCKSLQQVLFCTHFWETGKGKNEPFRDFSETKDCCGLPAAWQQKWHFSWILELPHRKSVRRAVFSSQQPVQGKSP